MSLVTEQVPHNETAFLLPILADAEEGEERIRATLLDPTCATYASWLDGQLAGAAVVRWEEYEPSEIIYIAVATALRGRGMESRSFTCYRRNCASVEGMRFWWERQMRHLQTLPSTRNAVSACLQSNATILRIFSRQ